MLVDSQEQIRGCQQPNFDFAKYQREQLKDKIQSAFLLEQLVDSNLRINVTSRLFVKKANPSDGFAQARNQLGTPGGAKSFLRGVQIFKLCPIRPVLAWDTRGGEDFSERGPKLFNSFQLCPTDFSRGCRKVCMEASPPFPPGYGPLSHSFKV